ncbi:MAG: NAD(P)-dependent oxidoreductase [Pelomonas sp.]|nr:NAD(P)-dependent oxidoreductase [Roseateles sp.]
MTSEGKPPYTALRFKRLLLTGAAGNIGRVLRPRLKAYCDVLRVSDIGAMDAAGPGEEVVPADLADKAAVHALLEGVDAVLHFGGVSVEKSFEEILPANIVGSYHLYEAARRHGVRRVVYASSSHVTGFYTQAEVITPQHPVRPDGYYGLSKVYGEGLAQFYFDRYGVETVSLRIGSTWPEPVDRRMLATWLSYEDLERLICAALAAPVVGHTIVYGVGANERLFWDNRSAGHLGFQAADSSAPFRAAVEARQPPLDPTRPEQRCQGGAFVIKGPFGDDAPQD